MPKKLTSTTLKRLLLWPCGLTQKTYSFLALFDGTGFLVQEIGGVFGILVIWDPLILWSHSLHLGVNTRIVHSTPFR